MKYVEVLVTYSIFLYLQRCNKLFFIHVKDSYKSCQDLIMINTQKFLQRSQFMKTLKFQEN